MLKNKKNKNQHQGEAKMVRNKKFNEEAVTEERVHNFWAKFQKAVNDLNACTRSEHSSIPEYFAHNFINVIPREGGISKCKFMQTSFKLGYLQKRFGMEKTHYVVNIKKDIEPFVASRVLYKLANILDEKTPCKVEHEEIML
jgi:hypothetical protein